MAILEVINSRIDKLVEEYNTTFGNLRELDARIKYLDKRCAEITSSINELKSLKEWCLKNETEDKAE